MKYKLLLFCCFSMTFSLFSQIKTEHFIGSWVMEKKDIFTNLITLKKGVKGYGITIHLLDDFKIRESYSAPCGNDTGIYVSGQKGTGNWSYNNEDKIFTSSIPVLYSKNTFEIIHFYEDEIILKPLGK